jgi:hypothetical protein
MFASAVTVNLVVTVNKQFELTVGPSKGKAHGQDAPDRGCPLHARHNSPWGKYSAAADRYVVILFAAASQTAG